MTRTDSDSDRFAQYDSLGDYYRDHHEGTVVEDSPHHVVVRDIPSSGGAAMLPGGFGALRAIDHFWAGYDHEVHYTDENYHENPPEVDRVVIVRGDAEFNGGAN